MAATLLAAAALVVALLGVYFVRIELQYQETRSSAERVRESVGSDSSGPNVENLPALQSELTALESDMQELDRRIDTPIIGDIAQRAPVLGGQLTASQNLLRLGTELVTIAIEATRIGDEIRLALEEQGLRADEQPSDQTWLDVYLQHQSEIDQMLARFDAARAERRQLNDEALPDRSRDVLQEVDDLIERGARLRAEYASILPLLGPALGADEPARYLLLLQNAQEIRPGGGFIGMFALVTIDDGQLIDYRIDDIKELDQAYVDARSDPLAAPGPIQTYLGQEEWLPHDANWSADFPTTARLMLDMYAKSGLPEIDGVMAVNYSVVQAVLGLTGPIEAQIDDEESVSVGAANVIEFIESFRSDYTHKDVVSQLGSTLIDHVAGSDYETKKSVLFAIRDLANAREVQAYFIDPALQQEAQRRGWTGAQHAAAGQPQLALNLASVAGGKASIHLDTSTDLHFSGNTNGIEELTWDFTVEHTGDPDGDPKHHGFHLTWMEVQLPEGAKLISTSQAQADPDLISGQNTVAFVFGLVQSERYEVSITFSLSDPADQIYLRRQSGANDLTLEISGEAGSCTMSDQWMRLRSDEVLDIERCETRLAREDRDM